MRRNALEALHDSGQIAPEGGDEVLAQHAGQRGRRCLVAAARAGGDLRPLALRGLAPKVPQAMDESALAKGAGKARLDGADEPRRAVGDHEQRIGQAPPFEVLEERVQLGVSSFVPGARCSRTFWPSSVIQAQSTASRGRPACSRSATPSTKR
jgi:hypothetical protein